MFILRQGLGIQGDDQAIISEGLLLSYLHYPLLLVLVLVLVLPLWSLSL